MAVINALSEELYPVGTDIVTKYIGRDAEGYANFTEGKTINSNTGEYIDSNNAASDVYIPISPYYTYQKSANRLYNGTWYDENHNRISSFNLNNLQVQLLPKAPDNARYFRFASHPTAKANWKITITRIPVTSHTLQEARRRILLNTPHLETISDSIASFKTDLAAPVKDCKVYFTPVQEGSGDPSPDNVRTITGWDGVTVYKTGKNLLDPSKLKNQAGWNIIQIKVIPNTLYTCSSSKSAADGTSGLFIYFKNVNGGGGPTANNVSASSPVTVRSTSTGYVYLSQRIVSGDKTFSDVWIQVEVGAEATAYEPYVANDEIPVSWETEAGTVFGGYVDLVRGEVVEEWSQIASYSGETLLGEWISDHDVYTAGTSPTIGAQVAYKLATPITYQLTPETIKTLRGINNIWSNANGNIEVKFWKY